MGRMMVSADINGNSAQHQGRSAEAHLSSLHGADFTEFSVSLPLAHLLLFNKWPRPIFFSDKYCGDS